MRVHFLGIRGSGISAAASIARDLGFEVDGCDSQEGSSYSDELNKKKIKVFVGHNESHLKTKDLLVVSPAALYQKPLHKEVKKAKEKGILLTWQEFVGKFLQKGKMVISIAGTHGKSTTTSMASLLFENAGLDPTAIVGANLVEWGGNFRLGESKVFIIESDEFNDNFLHYDPEIIILNNVEFDHPDFFKSESQVFASFVKFIRKLKGKKILIINQKSKGIEKVLEILGLSFLKTINIYGYSLGKPLFKIENSLSGVIISIISQGTVFDVLGIDLKDKFRLRVPGEFNVENALGVIILGNLFGIDSKIIKQSLLKYKGIGRRMELIGKKNNILVFSDYAHHPTAISKTLLAFRQKFPKKKIRVVVEPHSFSRTKTLLKQYRNIFDSANQVIVGPIYKARDTNNFGVSGESIVKASKHNNISYIDSIDGIIVELRKNANNGDVIVVMGAGESYKWANEIMKNI